jgi:kinesin family protein 1
MAESALTSAVAIKEANVIAHELEKRVAYQLTILDGAPHVAPAVSAVEGITGLADMDDGSDAGFDGPRPCVAVKVLDRHHGAVYLWSLEKLTTRLVALRNLYSYIDKPQMAQHLDWDEPFFSSPAPQYSHLGTALVSLAPLARPTQTIDTATVYSRHTGQAIATCRIMIKPTAVVPPSPSPSLSSSATDVNSGLPDGARLSFEITVDRVRGLDAADVSSVHCQIRLSSFVGKAAGPDEVVPSSPFDVDDDGETSLRLHRKLAVSVTPVARRHLIEELAAVDFFGRVKPSYIDRLERWDVDREARATATAQAAAEDVPAGRRNEIEFVQELRHDVSASIQICELAATGKYQPVPLIANTPLDPGAFFLRQGLQRRIVLKLMHGSGRTWTWSRIGNVQLGDVRLLDSRGLVHGSPSREPSTLKPVDKVRPTFDADGTATLDFVAPWDSSTHDSPFLNRPTAASSRALLRLSWDVDLPHCAPVVFELDIGVSVQSRDARGPGGLFGGFFSTTRTLERANALFNVVVTPAMAKTSNDLWRRDTSKVRVRGEEALVAKGWRPRGISLIEDHEALVRKERMAAEVAATKALLAEIPISRLASASAGEDEEEKLQSAVALWAKRFGPSGQARCLALLRVNGDTDIESRSRSFSSPHYRWQLCRAATVQIVSSS